MSPFKGFPDGNMLLTPVPSLFFSQLLPYIDHLGELKLTLYIFWQLERKEGNFRYFRREDFLQDELLMQGLGESQEAAQVILDESLKRMVTRGTLLAANLRLNDNEEKLYFLNSSKGRAAVNAIIQGHWKSTNDASMPVELVQEMPNIYQLYEENIGPLTPLIAEALNEADTIYPNSWIQDAFRLAVERNKRNWRYIEAILKRWQEEGRDERKDRQDAEEDRYKYIKGKYSDFVEH